MMELSWSTPKRIIEHKEDASYGLERLEMVYGKPYVHQIKKFTVEAICFVVLYFDMELLFMDKVGVPTIDIWGTTCVLV